MTDCIFCKIIEGTIPSTKIYEDDHVYAFMDIMPVTKGHVLLIPKNHVENVYDLTPEVAGHLFSVAPLIANALKAELNPKGMNLLQNNGSFAGQTVFHFHLHFVPRFDDSDGFSLSGWNPKTTEYTPERINEIAIGIRKSLEI
ncbi:HIT family protein [Sporosarcina sp. CAU 1771]